MHREFRELLDASQGVSESVIIVFVDIRNFSVFSSKVDSVDTALYLKKVYALMVDKYFTDAVFFKPTGDGLLVVIPMQEVSLAKDLTRVVSTCIKLVDDFATLTAGIPMINFEVPKKLGIGLVRGSACRLLSGEKTLDYSGRFLNLASRLVDLARPEGIVTDGTFGVELLLDRLSERFDEQRAFVRSFAEKEPMSVYCLKGKVVLPDSAKKPVDYIKYNTVTYDRKFSVLVEESEGAVNFRQPLPTRVLNSERIRVKLTFPWVHGGRVSPNVAGDDDLSRVTNCDFESEPDADYVVFGLAKLVEYLRSRNVPPDETVSIAIRYPEV